MIPTAKNILITGGMGLIGSHIARLAHLQGHRVTLLDLPGAFHRPVPYTTQAGSVCNLSSVQKAMRGQDWIIHCAGNPNLWAQKSYELYQVNTQGTLNVLKLMTPGQKLIHMSSDCTLISKQNKTVREDSVTSLKDMTGHYCKSKWLAEQAVLKACEQGIDASIINPGIPVSLDIQKAPFIQMVHSFLTGKISGYIHGNMSWIEADDLAQCTLTAAALGSAGRRYLGVHSVISICDLFKEISRLTGLPAPTWRVSRDLARFGAALNEAWGVLSGTMPLATRAGVELATNTHTIDNQWTLEALDLSFNDPTPTFEKLVLSMHRALNPDVTSNTR